MHGLFSLWECFQIKSIKTFRIFKYDSRGGIPTKGLMEGYEGSFTSRITRAKNIVEQNIVDSTVYAVVQCTTEEMTMNDLINCFVKKLSLGMMLRSLFILSRQLLFIALYLVFQI